MTSRLKTAHGMRIDNAGAPINDRADHLGHRRRKHAAPMLALTAITLLASLVTLAPAGAAEEAAGESASGAATASADPAPNDSAGDVEVVRYTGADPYGLSLAVAQALVDASGGASEWVVLASGESWADAVTAGPLAASLGAPVVSVPPGGLQTSAARPNLVNFLRSTGVRRVVIVGSPDVLPNHEPSVLFGLGMLPRNIERVHGDDPVGTSVAVARRIGVPADLGELGRTVIIANNHSVADAVAVGPLAASGPFPLLLTAPDELDPRIAAYLTEHEVAHAVLVGGTAAIALEVQAAIETSDVTVTRLAGSDRSDTARLAAELFEQHTADDPACTTGPVRIGLVPAQHPERALIAGPLLARNCTPLRYTDSGQLPADLRNTIYLAQQQSGGVEVLVFASESAIKDATLSVSLPPVRLAFVSVGEATQSGKRNAQIAVVDEHGATLLFSQTKFEIPAWPPTTTRVCGLRELDWSPAGRYLSYLPLCTGDVFVLDTVTGESYRVVYEDSDLTFGEHSEEGGGWDSGLVGPSWSPDGSSFVFTAFVDDPATVGTWRDYPLRFAELFVHDVESRTTRRLTENAVHDLVGSWSPDGNVVTRMQHAEPIASDPYYRAARWYAFTRVSESGSVPRHSMCGVGPRATWSPDGSRLAYHLSDGWWTRQVAVCTSESTNRRQLTPIGCSDCADGHQHTGASILGWNHSGSMLAFSDTDFVQEDGILDYDFETTADYVLDLESGEVRKLFESTHGSYGLSPLVYLDWSQEGNGLWYLRFGEDRTAPPDLVWVDVATGEATTLRDIPLRRLDQDRPLLPGLRLSPDQHQLLLVYDEPWYDEPWRRRAGPVQDGGLWLTSVQPADSTPLIDFDPIISMAAGDMAFSSLTDPPEWRCATDWTAIGILSACEYHW